MKFKFLAISALLVLATVTWGQVNTEPGVGRISFIRGDVSTQRGDSGEQSAAALNAPVVAGDQVSTGDNGRTELQLDYANILRLSERSEANVATLSQKQIQVQIGQGLVSYSVFKNSDAEVEIDTPNVSIYPAAKEGEYRILVASDSETTVVVRRGKAEIATPRGRTKVESGDMIIIRGAGDDTAYKITDASGKDEFDRWASDRDKVIRTAQSWDRTNRYYVGSEDLDSYGKWTTVPDYGPVWVPAVTSGWAPYRAGRWVWEPYWGWTWVSYDPWGWAPYHYGRWFMYGSSWAWWPGPSYGYPAYRPVWAPAYVSFFGFGGGVGVSVGFGWGSIGWLPIGPCDHYYPWWGGYRSHYNVVSVTNIYNIHEGGLPPLRTGTRYSNVRLAMNDEHMRGAISTVPANDFGRGAVRPQAPTHEAFNRGHLVTGNLPVVPTRESLSASGRPAASTTLLARGNQPGHFLGRTPSSANRQPFATEAAQIRSEIRQGGGVETANNAREIQIAQNREPQQPAPQGNSQSTGQRQTTNQQSSGEWRKFSSPRTTSPSQPPRSPNATTSPRNGAPSSAPQSQRPPSNRDFSGDWRHVPSPRSSDQTHGSGPSNGRPPDRQTQAPPSSNRGQNDPWRHFTPNDRPSNDHPSNDRPSNDRPSNGSPANRNAGSSPYDRGYPGSTSRPAERGNGFQPPPRESRPPLQMGHPVVTPRNSAPSAPPHSGSGGRSSPPPSNGHPHR